MRKKPHSISSTDQHGSDYAKGETVVREALAVRAGIGEGKYLERRPFRNDELSRIRHIQLTGNGGRLITVEVTKYISTLPRANLSRIKQENRVAAALAKWCRLQGIPPVIEAMMAHNAQKFLRYLRSKELRPRTIENYRSSLCRLWVCILKNDCEFMRAGNFPEAFRTSTPIENPWMRPLIPVVRTQLRSSRRTARAAADADNHGLSLGPSATKKEADRWAVQMQPILLRFKRTGIKSAKEIARALNAAGHRTPRGKHWDATSVRRVETRLQRIDEVRRPSIV